MNKLYLFLAILWVGLSFSCLSKETKKDGEGGGQGAAAKAPVMVGQTVPKGPGNLTLKLYVKKFSYKDKIEYSAEVEQVEGAADVATLVDKKMSMKVADSSVAFVSADNKVNTEKRVSMAPKEETREIAQKKVVFSIGEGEEKKELPEVEIKSDLTMIEKGSKTPMTSKKISKDKPGKIELVGLKGFEGKTLGWCLEKKIGEGSFEAFLPWKKEKDKKDEAEMGKTVVGKDGSATIDIQAAIKAENPFNGLSTTEGILILNSLFSPEAGSIEVDDETKIDIAIIVEDTISVEFTD